MKIITNTPEETYELAYRMAKKAYPGQVIRLDGDLGVGKTVFAKGFAKGLGIDEPITSPTFTIVQEYKSGRLDLFHFDVYRISDPYEMDEIGFEDYIYSGGVCLIEWADLIEEIIPEGTTAVYIEKTGDNFDERTITIEGPGEESVL